MKSNVDFIVEIVKRSDANTRGYWAPEGQVLTEEQIRTFRGHRSFQVTAQQGGLDALVHWDIIRVACPSCERLEARIRELEALVETLLGRLQDLEARLAQDRRTSSRPPGQDKPWNKSFQTLGNTVQDRNGTKLDLKNCGQYGLL